MGFLDRLNRVAGEVVNPTVITDRAFQRGDRLMARGEQITGRLVGIERKLDGGNDLELFAFDATTTRGPLRAGARVRVDRMERLRLGMAVLLRGDDDGNVVLDWSAMSSGWGLGHGDASQKTLRSAPDDGVKDRALDMRVQRRLTKGTRAAATIRRLERKTVLGLATQNWDVGLELADGRQVAALGDEVPFYASWLAVPGAEVPVALDAKNPDRATVDWPAAANAAAGIAGGMNDAPPPGSVADVLQRDRATEHEAMATGKGAPAAAGAATGSESESDPVLGPIEGVTLDMWAAVEVGTARDRIPPAKYDEYAQTHGVPAGAWAAADAAWRARMTSDWRAGAKIGEALEAARKRR